jgi:formylglycine-generating enzyme
MRSPSRVRVLLTLLAAAGCVPEAKLHQESDSASMAGSAGTAPDPNGRFLDAGGTSEDTSGNGTLKFCNISTPDDGKLLTVEVAQGRSVEQFSAKPGECSPAAGEPCRSIPAGDLTISEVTAAGPEPVGPDTAVRSGQALLIAVGHFGKQGGAIVGPFSEPGLCPAASYNSIFPADCKIGGPVLGPPSCACLPADTCGKGDCCGSSEVSGGTFNRSNDASTPAVVSNFRLDDFEITVGRFRRFVEHYAEPAAGSGKNANDAQDDGWSAAWSAELPTDANALRAAVECDADLHTWTEQPDAGEGRPMNCITWFEAQAFCIWDGGRLPTEAEWNYAAANGSEQRLYPWSDPPTNSSITPDDANYSLSPGDACDGGCTPHVLPVGSLRDGDSAQQQHDLSGNLAEWVEDWHAATYQVPCHDCGALPHSTERAVRGGSFQDPVAAMSTAYRAAALPTSRSAALGARCARASVQ